MIEQTRFGGPTAPTEERGNCFAACLASILGCELDVVDAPFDEEDKAAYWLDAFQQRVILAGLPYRLLILKATGDVLRFLGDTLYIAGGPSPRGDYRHSCVYRGGELVHDPYPSGEVGFKDQQVVDIVVLVWIGSNGGHEEPTSMNEWPEGSYVARIRELRRALRVLGSAALADRWFVRLLVGVWLAFVAAALLELIGWWP